MTDHAHEVFALEQLLAVLERRLKYEQFDYDAAVPALKAAIEVAEDSLDPEDVERLAGFRKTHSRMYEKRAAPPPGDLEINPKLKPPDLRTTQDVLLQELQQFLSNLDTMFAASHMVPSTMVDNFRESGLRFLEAFEKYVRNRR